MYPTLQQKKVLEEWFNTSRYLYNKIVADIENNKSSRRFQDIRNKFITETTRLSNPEYEKLSKKIKDTKDDNIRKELKKILNSLEKTRNNITEWELKTPKSIRQPVAKEVETAYKSNQTNLSQGNIKFFKMKFRRKTSSQQVINLEKSAGTLENGILSLTKTGSFEKDGNIFKHGKFGKKYKNLSIKNDFKIMRKHGQYYILIPHEKVDVHKKEYNSYCGVDPGVRELMTVQSDTGFTTYTQKQSLLSKLSKKIAILKSLRVRKKQIVKREERMDNITNEIHYHAINDLLDKNDVIFYGDIKSHDIVKKSYNKTLKKDINSLKFFKFKSRLLYKAKMNGNKVFPVNEAFTTKTCSTCGLINNPGISKVYNCLHCNKNVGRDEDAAKCILMKGLIENNFFK